ncbi:GGDEF domain-containing protein [Piscinibacter gummiphilus]|uniref:diguanylate cyclase n=1 Tax=Piscinibacter gummiphilus TaxID=946333 RepID=A0ABZ0CY65_9BURK|nr:GGDEF domain-containing protein [Piscinibacter gummiphilus]WOB09904.1 GGDEF domain-containing protein [Piscinibacter gummiphilus]
MTNPPRAEAVPAALAKAALRRLVMDKQEPTPENYARAYHQEAGTTPPAGPPAAGTVGEKEESAAQADALAKLIERVVRGVQRGGRQWTTARKKDSLQRVLSSSRSDVNRLQQRLNQLINGWESDTIDGAVDPEAAAMEVEQPWSDPTQPAPLVELPSGAPAAASDSTPIWHDVMQALSGTLQQALPAPPAPSAELSDELAALVRRIRERGPTVGQSDELDQLCKRATRALAHRQHLIEQLGTLCGELTASLVELAEDQSWAQGQSEAMRDEIGQGLTSRSVKSVSELLHHTREHQKQLRIERTKAQDQLKQLITRMLAELGELGSQTGRFHENIGRYADVIERADSLESLAGVVREMVEESRTVQSLVKVAQGKLQYEHERATDLSERVVELETELRRLSEEVSTDQLTKIANRRGLLQAFDAERARQGRDGSTLSIGLLDIDNFKKLNDELGHNAGDVALKSLAEVVSKTLRPTDMVARYGGEEFVVLLPNTPVNEGEQILTRLQRSLSGGLFMHEDKRIFVTFSAGVTAYRPGERIEVALERADEALYEAKRTGKNRTCIN